MTKHHDAPVAHALLRLVLAGASLGAALGLVATPARVMAQTFQQQQLEERGLGAGLPHGDWNINVGGGIGLAPRYPGSNTYRIEPIPFVLISYRDTFFFGPMGLGYNAIKFDGFRAGLLLGGMPGRTQSLDPHLNGLGDVSASLAAGAYATYFDGPFSVTALARQAVTNTQNGLQGLVSADLGIPLVERTLLFNLGPEAEIGNSEYARTWFGVSPAQSAQSGLAVHTASGGVTDVGVHASLTYVYSAHVVGRALIDVRRLIGDAGSSPIVQSRDQAVFGFGAAYHF